MGATKTFGSDQRHLSVDLRLVEGKSDQKRQDKIPAISEVSFASRHQIRSPETTLETVSFKHKSTSASRHNQFVSPLSPGT